MADYTVEEANQMLRNIKSQMQDSTGAAGSLTNPLTDQKLLYSNDGKIYSGSVNATWLNGLYAGASDSSGFIYDLSVKNKIQGYNGGDLVFGDDYIVIDGTTHDILINPPDNIYIHSDAVHIGLIDGSKELNLHGALSHQGDTLGLYGNIAVTQPSAITDADGTLEGNQTTINSILTALRNIGIIAST